MDGRAYAPLEHLEFDTVLSEAKNSHKGNEIPESGMVGVGVYKVGVDIPAGTLRIKVDLGAAAQNKEKMSIKYAVAKKPEDIEGMENAHGQFYVELEKGDYLSLKTYWGEHPINGFLYEKIED